jgi:hypothetical protein
LESNPGIQSVDLRVPVVTPYFRPLIPADERPKVGLNLGRGTRLPPVGKLVSVVVDSQETVCTAHVLE